MASQTNSSKSIEEASPVTPPPKKQNISTMTLLSVEISELMELISDKIEYEAVDD